MMKQLLFTLAILPLTSYCQNFTAYFTGNSVDTICSPLGGLCLMGGATENDHAMKWFLQRANGGDVLVLRTSGSDGYNDYLYTGLGVPVNSVETIVCHNSLASQDSSIIQKIGQAEAIWFAGGDQWTYINYWRNTPLDSAINQAILQRNIVIGGTSAGMAIQGGYYFSAQNGTVTSAASLADPYNPLVTIDTTTFLNNSLLKNTITDTHFDNPDRKGRVMAFLARLATDYDIRAKAIACDEYTAICIDTSGIARVFGGYPTYDDNAYFMQSDCDAIWMLPENCTSANPLTWNLSGRAVKAYQIKGDSSGSKTFDLKSWGTGTGGTWHDWSVINGSFNEKLGKAINCTTLTVGNAPTASDIYIYPNPTNDLITVSNTATLSDNIEIQLYNSYGQRIRLEHTSSGNDLTFNMKDLPSGVYFLMLGPDSESHLIFKIIKT